MPRDFEYFYEWDGLAENWITSEESFDQDFPSKPQDAGTSVAAWVIEDVFNLDLNSGDRQYGSYLPGYDIKNRDAYQMIQLSLAAELKNNHQMECYADGDGIVNFYSIGENNSNIRLDVLYEISTGDLSKPCDNVMVIGYDPPPKRYAGQEFNLLTFANNAYEHTNDLDDDSDARAGNYPMYHVWGDILGPEGCDYYRQGYIEYGDPHFDQEGVLISMGVFDRAKYETVSFYVHKIHVPFFEHGSTSVQFYNRTPKFVELTDGAGVPDMGTLQRRIWRTDETYVPELCRLDQTADPDTGIRLPRSNERKFLGIREVYIYGYKLTQINLDCYMDGNERVCNPNANFVVHLDSMLSEPFRLSQSQDYVVVKDDLDPTYYKIVFSCNVHKDYVDNFGGKAAQGLTNAEVRISPYSIYAKENDVLFQNQYVDITDLNTLKTGYLKDGKTLVDNKTSYSMLIYPIDRGQAGYAVKKIVVVYDWDNPCVGISDERNAVTRTNLEDVSFSFYPVIMQDRPAPIAIDSASMGTLSLDPTEILPDYDATTVENLDSTTYARAFASLEQGDIKVTLPFLYTDDGEIWNSTECEKVAKYIRGLQNEVVESTTYVCGPDAEPVLGERIDGKVINSIDYSYQDSSQYLISVQAGPIWQGIQSWDTSIYQNKTERLQLEGIVINVYPDNNKCQVKLEQLGVMECINGSRDILEKGDRVSVTVYNNPVAK